MSDAPKTEPSDLVLTERGVSLLSEGRLVEADQAFREARERAEPGFQLLYDLALQAARGGDNVAADRRLTAALAFDSTAPAALLDHGVILRRLGQGVAALARFDEALRAQPDLAKAHVSRANVLNDLKRWPEALAASNRALELQPSLATAANAAGNALVGLGQAQQAVARFQAAIALSPGYVDPQVNLGNTLLGLGRARAAFEAYDAAVRGGAQSPAAFMGRANALAALGLWREAAEGYEAAAGRAPEWPMLRGRSLHARMKICDWRTFATDAAALRRSLRAGRLSSPPFPLLALPSSAAEQKRCAELHMAAHHGRGRPAPPPRPPGDGDRIRVGYFSADFHEHATAYLMADLFETHDRARFEIVGFSFGPKSGSPIRQRVEAAFERFFDVSGLGDETVVELSRSLGIDIAVDLKGETTGSRPGVFAQRAAPVQVSYIGYPGATGADFIDYLVADPILIPEAERIHYGEKVAYLPVCYQPNDRHRVRPPRRSRREDHGLPPDGFVFASFNNNYKILPEVFAIWMQLLWAVPGSVLWLFEDNPDAAANLRAEAALRGVDPARLVFAARAPLEAHLERHHHIDLFLDTSPCCAHTTASDALWMGAPVLTRLGDTFAGRVAASLLNAVGLPELVTTSADAYEALALDLARDRTRLSALRAHLEATAAGSPLFDTPRLARDLEALYVAMRERALAGLPPDHLTVG